MSFLIIGLTGRNASGKGAIATFLKKKSFQYHSLSDTLRKELTKKGQKETRDNLVLIGNELRYSGGPGVLADMMIKNLLSPENHIVDSIRNPFEVNSLRRIYNNHRFYLIAVDATPEIRFERLKLRDRVGDISSWKEFIEQELLEEESADVHEQQLLKTIQKADFIVDNSGTIKDLESSIAGILDKL